MDVRRFTLLILLIAFCPLAAAQSGSVRSESNPDAAGVANLLVLVDGRIVAGKITPRPDGYDVEVAAGRMFIDSNRVRFEANSLPNAYDRMRDSLAEFTPANHLDLARWCLENKLYSQARREILDALNLDPNREDAKRMLRALEHIGEKSGAPNVGSGLTEYPSLAEMKRPAVESRSLAGLSRTIAHSFMRDVQPLMTNKCATAGCHGIGAKNEFEITSTRRVSTPALAERNLAAILKQIDFSQPAASPLLRVGGEAHGNMASSAFPGRSGALQMQVLQDWVMQAAQDIAPDAAVTAAVDHATKDLLPTSETRTILATSGFDSSRNVQHAMHSAPGNPHARTLTTDETDARFLREAKYANRQDAFSPDEFNRRYHGSATKSASRQSATELQSSDSNANETTDAQLP